MSTNFTPTTEYVKNVYVGAVRNSFIASTPEIEAEFDAWLAEHDREAYVRGYRKGYDDEYNHLEYLQGDE